MFKRIQNRIVYCTINLVNGKIYIGKDKFNIKTYYGSGTLLLLAIKKYGKKVFQKNIIDYCSSDQEMENKEIYYIKLYDSLAPIGYNMTLGGTGGDIITNNPNKEKILQHRKLLYKTGKLVVWNKGKTGINSKLTSRKQRNAKLGKKQKTSICIHCGVKASIANIKHFHNENCFKRPNIDVQQQILKRKHKKHKVHKKLKRFKCKICKKIVIKSHLVQFHNDNCKYKT